MTSKAAQPVALAADAPRPLPRLARPPSVADWIPTVSIRVDCQPTHFHEGLLQLVLYPEQSSSTILRAEILADDRADEGHLQDNLPLCPLQGYTCIRRVRRRIIPNRPQFDWAMEQECLFYDKGGSEAGETEALVLLLPDFAQLERERGDQRLPYYHPQVHALAFRYLSDHSGTEASLRIDLVPLPSQPLSAPLSPNDRLFRTAQVLAKYAAKLCNGQAVGYQKRIHHDLLVGRTAVQDTYQRLKDKYQANLASLSLSPSPRITFRWMLHSWQESTDATKHVFEDVAIAAWLVTYWAEIYPGTDGKPPGGFVDVGCGNGLLVYILTAEGYDGYGFDLRERKSWASYTSPRPDLRVQSLNPATLLSSALEHSAPDGVSGSTTSSDRPFPRDSFLMFNHADEMTPWCPLLAALTPGSHVGFLNIPCCLHELAGRFERQTYTIPATFLADLPPSKAATDSYAEGTNAWRASLPDDLHPLLCPFYAAAPLSYSTPAPKGAKASASSAANISAGDVSILGGRYHAYQLYLAHLTLRCGFIPAREALRIPSTKNFGLVGGRSPRSPGETGRTPEEIQEEVRELLAEVARKGEWRARKPEGKAGEQQSGH